MQYVYCGDCGQVYHPLVVKGRGYCRSCFERDGRKAYSVPVPASAEVRVDVDAIHADCGEPVVSCGCYT